MKTCWLSCGLAAVLNLFFSTHCPAQAFRVILNFKDSNQAYSMGSPAVSSNIIYGTTYYDGSQNEGMVFKVHTDGTGFGVLRNFSPNDGGHPVAGVIVSSNMLFGTTQIGGINFGGTIFRVNMDGSDFTLLKSFSSAQYGDGRFPYASLVLSGSSLYGTTSEGGSAGQGTVFKINTDGSGYTVLKSFLGTDGAYPKANVVLSADGLSLYGTTAQGGSAQYGTVFRIGTDGGGFKVLANLGTTNGQLLYSSVALLSNTLYGIAGQGGVSNYGTIFKVGTDGSDFAVLKNFISTDGSFPAGGLTVVSNVLYGAAQYGGTAGYGTLFRINPDGSDFAVIRNMSVSDGIAPYAGLTLVSNVLYGTTQIGGDGGVNDGGTVFALTVGSTPVTTNQISVHWPGNGKIELNYAGSPGTNYILDQTHSLARPISWQPVGTNAADMDGTLHFTNIINSTNTFWRIRSGP